MFKSQRQASGKTLQRLLLLSVSMALTTGSSLADNTANVNTGMATGSVIGNNSQEANGAGIGINGSVSGSNLNNNQNSNTNVIQPIVLTQPKYMAGGSSNGGSAALVLPRNPLAMPNASLGRSNFGLQFGLQNNPGLSNLSSGNANALGWFMQGALTIPFGKIPSVYNNQANAQADTMRQSQMDEQRKVFAAVDPASARQAAANVQGKVVGLNAYNYSTVPSGRLPLQTPGGSVGDIVMPQPKVLAMKPADAFTQPLNTGERIGVVEVGKEYPYLGHTRSGWVKILLPSGKEAWTATQLEYIKFDYTEIDTLAVDSHVAPPANTASVTLKDGSNTRKRRS